MGVDLTEADTFNSLLKSIYEGGRIKTTTSKNTLFLEAVILKQRGGHTIKPASKKVTAQQV